MQRTMAILFVVAVGACGPAAINGGDDTAECSPGEREECYSGVAGTKGVGPCRGGTRTCEASGTWGPCTGEVAPVGENCTDGVDNNCNGMTDENVDADGDGVTTCGGDCCDSTECTNPAGVNAGAFDVAGNNFDDDCNGVVDDQVATCDANIASSTQNAMDYAKAIDLCQTTTMTDTKWGVISATLTLADGTGSPAAAAQSVRPKFGPGVLPKTGASLALLSTGHAAAMNDTMPDFQDFQNVPSINGNSKQSGFPADFLAANNNKLPNAPNCPAAMGTQAMDPVMLTLTIRVPTNAKSFKLATNFFSSEYPEFTCSPYNDFFVVLLDSTYAGMPANPTDKNLAFYSTNGMKYPVGVNLASGNTGLFQQCVNGRTGCGPMSIAGTISTCMGIDQITGTGLDKASPNACDANSLQGGGTGWLETTGNVTPGEIMKLRIAIWDTSDHILDSIAVIDSFKWDVDTAQPGTVIFRQTTD